MVDQGEINFRFLAENSVDIICLVGLDLVMHYASPSCEAMLGWTPEEMCDKGPDTFVFDEDLPVVEAAHKRLMVHGVDTIPTTIRMKRKNGTLAWIEVNARVLKSPQEGEVTGIVLTMRDVTERKAAETQIQNLNSRLELALNTGGIGIWEADLISGEYLLDSRMHAIYVGKDGYRANIPANTFGGNLEEWLSIVHPDDLAEVKRVAVGMWNGVPFTNFEHRILKASGEIRYVRSSGQTFFDAHGVPVRAMGTTQDVSEERMATIAMQSAEKLAAAGRLARAVAHEINNPLQSLTNLLHIAEEATRQDKLHPIIKQGQDELARVSSVVTQTLRFHRQSEKAETTHLGELTRSVLALHRSRLDAASILVEVDERQRSGLFGYKSDLRQMLANLISNALDAVSGQAGAKVVVRIRDAFDSKTGNTGIRLTVADCGSGIDVVTQKRLFEPFFSTKGVRSAGLGLWVCKEILERHKARFYVKSSTHSHCHGTVFTAFFPLETNIDSHSTAMPM